MNPLEELIGEIDDIFDHNTCKEMIDGFEKNIKLAIPYGAEGAAVQMSLPEALEVPNHGLQNETSETGKNISQYLDEGIKLWFSHAAKTINCSIESIVRTLNFAGMSALECTVVKQIANKTHYEPLHCDGNLSAPLDPGHDTGPVGDKRYLTSITYLNTVEDGGETEFWWGQKVKAEIGKSLVFPSQFPFFYKNNHPISNDRYSLVSWANNLPNEKILREMLKVYTEKEIPRLNQESTWKDESNASAQRQFDEFQTDKNEQSIQQW